MRGTFAMPASPIQPEGGSPYASASQPGSSVPASGAAFTVSRTEVLAKRAALLAEAEEFQQFLNRIRDDLRMEPMGGDPVSGDVARGVTDRIRNDNDSYFNVCQTWVNNLFNTADSLTDVARQYGFTDEEIAASFSRGASVA